MKELSIEEKAKAYDEVREKIAIRFGSNVADEIFSEYEESEDENIIKALIDEVSRWSEDTGFGRANIPRNNILAWLEKQGEQKLADKVEPKFKVGDWIVYKDTVWKICNMSLKTYYELLSINNEVIIRHFEGVDKTAHLWTIKDARDGDVLVCKGDIKYSNGIKYKRICLFKNLDNAFFTLTKTSNYVEEYGIDVNIDYPDNTVPATKEQKEILFMAMKYAGYTFDFEKKELKKIERD